MTLDEYKWVLAGLRKHFPDICMFQNRSQNELDEPIVSDSGNVISPDLAMFGPYPSPDVGLHDILPICGCGYPEHAAMVFLRHLQRCARTDYKPGSLEIECRRPSTLAEDDLTMMMLYWMDNLELTEHGTSVFCSSLTDKGKFLEDYLLVLQKEHGWDLE